jgi:cytochrome b involved in lipid metabolism
MGCFPSKNYYTWNDINEMKIVGLKIVVYKKKIYNITYLSDFEHPAGEHLITSNIGKDITKHMNFHSKNAVKMITQDFIGYLKE